MALTKKITGAIVAIAFVLTTIITFAFKSEVKSEADRASLRWFKISGAHAPSTSVPTSDAVYIQTSVNPPNNPEDCDGDTNQCVSGFNTSQTAPSGSSFVLNGSQTPVTTSAEKDKNQISI
ncbi:hypothetical protein [Pedobacter sp. NJ-S-72]